VTLGGGLFALLSVLGAPLPAAAAPEPAPAAGEQTAIRIELDAPSDCATAEGFYENVRARTERVRPVAEGELGVRVVVKLVRTPPARVHGELRVIGEHGESDARRVDGNTCREVVEALSLTAALAVDPTAVLTSPQAPEPAPTAAPAPAPSPPPPLPPPPPPPARRLEVRLGAGAYGIGQVSPYVSLGGELSVRVVAPWDAAPSLGLALVYAKNDLFDTASTAFVRSTLFELTACPRRWSASSGFSLEPCLLGLGGWLSAQGHTVTHPEAVTRSYFGAGGKLMANVTLAEHWDLELAAGFAVPFARRRFVYATPRREVALTPGISGLGSGGITYSF
jgi:hypothetical protein